MATAVSPSDLAQRIQRLLEQRQQCVDTLAGIDQTLVRINAAFQPVSAPVKAVLTPQPSAQPPTAKARKQVKRKKFALSGKDSILALVKAKKNPTTQDLKDHWAAEGRGGTPDSDMSYLVKEGKLRRAPHKEGRGSRYLLA